MHYSPCLADPHAPWIPIRAMFLYVSVDPPYNHQAPKNLTPIQPRPTLPPPQIRHPTGLHEFSASTAGAVPHVQTGHRPAETSARFTQTCASNRLTQIPCNKERGDSGNALHHLRGHVSTGLTSRPLTAGTPLPPRHGQSHPDPTHPTIDSQIPQQRLVHSNLRIQPASPPSLHQRPVHSNTRQSNSLKFPAGHGHGAGSRRGRRWGPAFKPARRPAPAAQGVGSPRNLDRLDSTKVRRCGAGSRRTDGRSRRPPARPGVTRALRRWGIVHLSSFQVSLWSSSRNDGVRLFLAFNQHIQFVVCSVKPVDAFRNQASTSNIFIIHPSVPSALSLDALSVHVLHLACLRALVMPFMIFTSGRLSCPRCVSGFPCWHSMASTISRAAFAVRSSMLLFASPSALSLAAARPATPATGALSWAIVGPQARQANSTGGGGLPCVCIQA